MASTNLTSQTFVCHDHQYNNSLSGHKRWLDRFLGSLKPLQADQTLALWSNNRQAESSTYAAPPQTKAIALASPLAPLQRENPLKQPLNRESGSGQDAALGPVAQPLLNQRPINQKPATPIAVPAMSSRLAVEKQWNIPYDRNAFFTGREAVLQTLSQQFTPHKAVTLPQIQAISGRGGIGKTQLAIEYAYRHRDTYQAVFWVRAETGLDVRLGFIGIARLLNLPQQNAPDPNDTIQAVKRWLEMHSDWLLIFDNADRPELLKPFYSDLGQGHILLTSRAQTFDILDIAQPVSLAQMSEEEAAAFLFKRTGRNADYPDKTADETATVTALTAKLRYLPLALEQAGAYLSAQELSFAEYLKRYREWQISVTQRAGSVPGHYPSPIATTWALSFQAVQNTSKAAANLLRASAFLSPHEIPYEVFEQGISELGQVLANALAKRADKSAALADVLTPLTRYSLIYNHPGSRTYSLSKMVQTLMKEQMSKENCRCWVENVLGALTQTFSQVEYGRRSQRDRILPHVQTITELTHNYHIKSETTALLAMRTSCHWDKHADYDATKHLYLEAHSLYKQRLESNHLEVATGLNNLATLYKNQGLYEAAESLYIEAFDLRKQHLGKDHPDVAASLNNLAALYSEQGQYKAAESLYLEAQALYKQHFGNSHPDVAANLNHLAALYKAQGRSESAESLFLEALVLYKQLFGRHHHQVADSLDQLATFYYEQGRNEAAKPLWLDALRQYQQLFGDDHPATQNVQNNLKNLQQY